MVRARPGPPYAAADAYANGVVLLAIGSEGASVAAIVIQGRAIPIHGSHAGAPCSLLAGRPRAATYGTLNLVYMYRDTHR